MADAQVKLDIVVRSISEAKKIQRDMGDMVKSIKVLDTGVGSLGNKLGFVAFQFTFMAGVAGRALGDIQRGLKEMIDSAADAEDQVIRAIGQSGLDITRQAEGSAEAIKFLNDVIRDFGSGRTIFDTGEVAQAAKEIGRAFNFVGTQEQIAVQNALVLEGALKLMTIEEISAERAAVQLSKSMKQFNLTAKEVGRVVDVLVTVNQQSAVTLDELTASISASGNIAREAGVDFETLAVSVGVMSDRIGVKGSAAGRAFRRIMEGLQRTTTAQNEDLIKMGVHIRDSSGKMRNAIAIFKDFREAMKKAGKEGDILRQVILEGGTESILAKDALLALIQGVDDLEQGMKNLENVGVGDKLAALFSETTEGRIKRLKATIQSLQIDFTAGLSPAIVLIVQELRQLVTEGSGFAELIRLVGTELGNELVPAIRTLVKFIKALSNTLRNNELLVSVITKGFVGLLGVLTSLFIVGTIGSMFALMASGIQKVLGFMGLTKVAAIGLTKAFLPLFITGLGIFLALKAIDNIIGIVKDGFTEAEVPAFALNTALLALGGTLTALTIGSTIKTITDAIRGLGLALSGTKVPAGFLGNYVAEAGNAGTSMGTKLTDAFKSVLPAMPQSLTSILQKFSTAGPIALAVVAGVAVGLALAYAIRGEIEAAEDFGMNSAGELMIFRLGHALKAMSLGVGQWVKDTVKNFNEIQNRFGEILNAIIQGDWESAYKNFKENFADPIWDSLTDIFDGLSSLGQAIADPIKFELTSGKKAVQDFLEAANAQGKLDPFSGKQITGKDFLANPTLTPEQILISLQNDESFKDLLEINGQEYFTKQKQIDAIEQWIAQQVDASNLQAQISEKMIGYITATDEVALANADYRDMMLQALEGVNSTVITYDNTAVTNEKFNEEVAKGVEKFNGLSVSTDLLKTANTENTAELGINTKTVGDLTSSGNTEIGKLKENSSQLLTNSKTLVQGTDVLGLEILEIARNQNRLIDFTIEVDRAGIAFSLLAREGAEAARRLSTLKVSKDGVFSISGLSTAGVSSSEVAQLGSGFKDLNENLKDDMDLKKIDLDLIQKEQELIIATNTLSGDIKDLTTKIGGGASNLAELQQLSAFADILRKLNPDDANIKALVDTFNRDTQTKTIREILGDNLIPFIEAIIGRTPQLARGGLVTSPTLATIGERGAEAVIPLDQLGSLGGSNTFNITVNVEGLADNSTADDIANRVVDIINNNFSNKNTIRR